jgi:hypothetical protein
MAIKITKPGQKEFHGFCKWCGCEFTYEISDLKLSATSDKVSCPTCGKDYHHPSMVQDPTIPGGIGRLQTWPPEPIPCTPDMTKTDPCAGCVWRENLLRDGLYIGDTPCTWCDKNKFNCITSTQPSLEDYTTHCVDQLDTHLTTSTSSELSGTKYTTAYNSSDNVVSGEVMKTILNCCEANTSGIATNNTVYSPKNGSSTPPAPPTSGSNAVKSCNSCSGEHQCGGKKNCKGKH